MVFLSGIEFCEWFKRRRKSLDLTQGELAKRAGCSVFALRKIESGDRKPSKQLAELLAKALEISDDDLQTFIRVARGDINIERLHEDASNINKSIPDIKTLHQTLVATQNISNQPLGKPAPRIPLQVTPLIGRENEYAALERLFNESQCRLLTLTGIGGIGKTRPA